MADSYNELFGLGSHSPDANLEGWWPLQDDAASTTVLDYSGNGLNGTFNGAGNTADSSTAGPNSWLVKSLDFDGSNDYVAVASSLASATPITLLARYNTDVTGPLVTLTAIADASSFRTFRNFLHGSNQLRAQQYDGTTAGDVIGGAVNSSGTWYARSSHFSTNSSRRVVLNGTTEATNATLVGTPTDLDVFAIGALPFNSGHIQFWNGKIADVSVFSRDLSNAESQEWTDGPELINTVAPALSGTETVGQTLSSTTGTWALDAPFSGGSNGTASYSYQWTRSDDGSGTGEANISGATSSTYTLQAADAGKFVRCFVRATNDGGFDPAADTATAFTGAISGGAAIGAAAYYYRHLTSQVLR